MNKVQKKPADGDSAGRKVNQSHRSVLKIIQSFNDLDPLVKIDLFGMTAFLALIAVILVLALVGGH